MHNEQRSMNCLNELQWLVIAQQRAKTGKFEEFSGIGNDYHKNNNALPTSIARPLRQQNKTSLTANKTSSQNGKGVKKRAENILYSNVTPMKDRRTASASHSCENIRSGGESNDSSRRAMVRAQESLRDRQAAVAGRERNRNNKIKTDSQRLGSAPQLSRKAQVNSYIAATNNDVHVDDMDAFKPGHIDSGGREIVLVLEGMKIPRPSDVTDNFIDVSAHALPTANFEKNHQKKDITVNLVNNSDERESAVYYNVSLDRNNVLTKDLDKPVSNVHNFERSTYFNGNDSSSSISNSSITIDFRDSNLLNQSSKMSKLERVISRVKARVNSSFQRTDIRNDVSPNHKTSADNFELYKKKNEHKTQTNNFAYGQHSVDSCDSESSGCEIERSRHSDERDCHGKYLRKNKNLANKNQTSRDNSDLNADNRRFRFSDIEATPKNKDSLVSRWIDCSVSMLQEDSVLLLSSSADDYPALSARIGSESINEDLDDLNMTSGLEDSCRSGSRLKNNRKLYSARELKTPVRNILDKDPAEVVEAIKRRLGIATGNRTGNHKYIDDRDPLFSRDDENYFGKFDPSAAFRSKLRHNMQRHRKGIDEPTNDRLCKTKKRNSRIAREYSKNYLTMSKLVHSKGGRSSAYAEDDKATLVTDYSSSSSSNQKSSFLTLDKLENSAAVRSNKESESKSLRSSRLTDRFASSPPHKNTSTDVRLTNGRQPDLLDFEPSNKLNAFSGRKKEVETSSSSGSEANQCIGTDSSLLHDQEQGQTTPLMGMSVLEAVLQSEEYQISEQRKMEFPSTNTSGSMKDFLIENRFIGANEDDKKLGAFSSQNEFSFFDLSPDSSTHVYSDTMQSNVGGLPGYDNKWEISNSPHPVVFSTPPESGKGNINDIPQSSVANGVFESNRNGIQISTEVSAESPNLHDENLCRVVKEHNIIIEENVQQQMPMLVQDELMEISVNKKSVHSQEQANQLKNFQAITSDCDGSFPYAQFEVPLEPFNQNVDKMEIHSNVLDENKDSKHISNETNHVNTVSKVPVQDKVRNSDNMCRSEFSLLEASYLNQNPIANEIDKNTSSQSIKIPRFTCPKQGGRGNEYAVSDSQACFYSNPESKALSQRELNRNVMSPDVLSSSFFYLGRLPNVSRSFLRSQSAPLVTTLSKDVNTDIFPTTGKTNGRRASVGNEDHLCSGKFLNTSPAKHNLNECRSLVDFVDELNYRSFDSWYRSEKKNSKKNSNLCFYMGNREGGYLKPYPETDMDICRCLTVDGQSHKSIQVRDNADKVHLNHINSCIDLEHEEHIRIAQRKFGHDVCKTFEQNTLLQKNHLLVSNPFCKLHFGTSLVPVIMVPGCETQSASFLCAHCLMQKSVPVERAVCEHQVRHLSTSLVSPDLAHRPQTGDKSVISNEQLPITSNRGAIECVGSTECTKCPSAQSTKFENSDTSGAVSTVNSPNIPEKFKSPMSHEVNKYNGHADRVKECAGQCIENGSINENRDIKGYDRMNSKITTCVKHAGVQTPEKSGIIYQNNGICDYSHLQKKTVTGKASDLRNFALNSLRGVLDDYSNSNHIIDCSFMLNIDNKFKENKIFDGPMDLMPIQKFGRPMGNMEQNELQRIRNSNGIFSGSDGRQNNRSLFSFFQNELNHYK